MATHPERVLLKQANTAGVLRKTETSHISFQVEDLAVAVAFYNRVLGLAVHEQLPGGGYRLGWGVGHHVLDLFEGEHDLLHYGFEVRDENGLAGIRKRLSDAGYAYEELDPSYIDAPTGTPEGIKLVDADGTEVHFHTAVQRHGEHTGVAGYRPIKFQHTTLGTTDVQPLVDLFTTIGFQITDQLTDGRFAWLRSDKTHHTLAIVDVGRGGDIDHYAYDLAEWNDFKAWCDRLTELEIPVEWGPGRHGPGNNLFVFFNDPSGNHVELSSEMEKFWDNEVEYVARQWEPTAFSVNMWGGQTPTWRRVGQQR